jgi:hypothetical protein
MDIRPPERTATSSARLKTRDGTLLRVVAWGTCAGFAAAILAFVVQTPAGGERLKVAMAGMDEPVRPATAAQADPAIRLLEARIAALTSDRDRLVQRVAALENGLGDLTGSVGKSAASSPDARAGAGREPLPMVVAVAPPLINPLATPAAGVASILPEQVPTKATPEPAAPKSAAPESAAPESAAPESAASESAPAEPVPLPPERVAELTPAQAVKPAPAAVRTRPEFGVELATEANLDALRKRWAGVKANYGPLLVGLSPVAVRDQHPGSNNVRLVAGPLPSLTAARQLCARFAAANGNCWPARINPTEVIQR